MNTESEVMLKLSNFTAQFTTTMLLGNLSCVFIVGSNAGCTMFRGSVKSTGYDYLPVTTIFITLNDQI